MSAPTAESHGLNPDRIIERVDNALMGEREVALIPMRIKNRNYEVTYITGTDELGRTFQMAGYKLLGEVVDQKPFEEINNELFENFAFSETADFGVKAYQTIYRGLVMETVSIIDSYAISDGEYRLEMTRYEVTPVGAETSTVSRISIRKNGNFVCLMDFPYSGLHGDDLSTMLASLEL